jgi:hypothetical protein
VAPVHKTSLAPNFLLASSVHLQTRINLIRWVEAGICVPLIAQLKHVQIKVLFNDVFRTLQDLQEQTTANMPRQMAMKRPDTWIVLNKLQHHVAWCNSTVDVARILELVHITANGVARVDNTAIPLAEAFGQYVEIMAYLEVSVSRVVFG